MLTASTRRAAAAWTAIGVVAMSVTLVALTSVIPGLLTTFGPSAVPPLILLLLGAAFIPVLTPQRIAVVGVLMCAVPVSSSLLGGLPVQQALLLPAGIVLLLTPVAGQSSVPGWPRVFALGSVVALVAASLSDPVGSVRGLLFWLTFLVWLFGLAKVGRTIRPEVLVAALAAAGLIGAGLSSVGQVTGWSLQGRPLAAQSTEIGGGLVATRFAGLIADYELYAEWMSITFILCTWLALQSNGLRTWVWSGGLLLAGVQLLFTGSRSSLLLAALGFIAILLAGTSFKRLAGALVATSVAAVTVNGLVLGAIESSKLLPRLLNIQTDTGFASAINRSTVWRQFLLYEPFEHVVGAGPTYPYDTIGFYPHSLALYLGYTLGLIGLVTVIGLLVACAAEVTVAAARRRHGAYPTAVVLTVFLLNEVKVEFVRVDSYAVYIASLAGVALAVSRSTRQRQTEVDLAE